MKIKFRLPSEKVMMTIIIAVLLAFNIFLIGSKRSLSARLDEAIKTNEKNKIENAFSIDGQDLTNHLFSFLDGGEVDLFLDAEIKIVLFIKVNDCASCKMTLLDWNSIHQSLGGKVHMIGVFQGNEMEGVEGLKAEFHIKFKTIIDSSCDYYRYLSSKTNTPAAIILNKKNEVIAVETPYTLPQTREELKNKISMLIE